MKLKNYNSKFKKILSFNFLLRAGILIFLKEFYLFLRNLYGLVVHPFKTIVEIRKKPDWSQTILVFGLPVYGGMGVIGGIGVALVLLLFFHPTNEFLINLLFLLFACLVFLVSCYAFYLGFWIWKYLAFKRENPKGFFINLSG